MNTYLLGLISKWASIAAVTVTGIFSSNEIATVQNTNQTKNVVAEVKEVAYDTETVYNDKLPKDIKITKQEGSNGLSYIDSDNNELEVLKKPVNAVVEVGTGDYSEYIGKMTGYGADCAGCSKTGTVSCKTKDGSSWSLIKDGTTYYDDEYGEVRILAAALDKFSCGTIIEVTSSVGTFNAIVLDTGGAMRNAWSNGEIHMDLAFYSESSPGLHDVTSNNVKYRVQRWGF